MRRILFASRLVASSNGPSDPGFLHLDLMPDNSVRIDDIDTTKFGTFQRGQPFIVQVIASM